MSKTNSDTDSKWFFHNLDDLFYIQGPYDTKEQAIDEVKLSYSDEDDWGDIRIFQATNVYRYQKPTTSPWVKE